MTAVSDSAPSQGDQPDGPALERALKTVPRGAMALSGAAVLLLLAAWLAIYLFVFLPRGPVG
ncbi:MAG TPA: hypothetical protein VN802_02590 [Stellaceae bacterium]|nr:hypothetical protein [Stellaceae bacterium]